ncbi:MAG: SpoIIE family protein phosphatase [Planctomycetia bacterium]|nr:SpoIIE family protein phosphatase [Planctomycetia bacterium]
MANLQLINGSEAGRSYPLGDEKAVLGRHPDCEIVLDSGAVSRQHARVSHEEGQYFIEDLHSRNGTFVNDQPIDGRRALVNGDRLRICDLVFAFQSDVRPPVPFGPAGPFGQAPAFGQPVDESSFAVVVDDEDHVKSSTFLSKLELTNDSSRMRFEVNPLAKLQALLEITRNLSRSLSIDAVLPKVLDSLFKIFPQADRGFIVMRVPQTGLLVPKAVKFRRPDQGDTIRVSRTIVDQVMQSREAVLSADAASDARFQMSQSIADFRIRSMMCAPLIDSEQTALGVIQIDTLDQRSRFTEDDLEVLAGVAAPAGIAIENAQLHERSLKQQAVQLDLQMAHRVQQGLLPAAPPEVPGYRFFDFYTPANEVGGDFYDYVELPGGRLAVVLADVSGKGVSAALLMAKLSAETRYCLASEADPANAMNRLNASFIHAGWEDRFVTLVVAVLEPATGIMKVFNAGHPSPLMRRSAGIVEEIEVEQAGLPIGVDPDHRYKPCEVRLAPGEAIALFTDGFSEAMNREGQLYGIERLRQRLSEPVADVGTLGPRVLSDVKQFVNGRAQSDDMCLICVARK